MRPVFLPVLLFLSSASLIAQPLKLLPQNPHYFQYQNKPMVLVGSGEHYGAVVNLDFDYKSYLNTLHTDRLNTTASAVRPALHGGLRGEIG